MKPKTRILVGDVRKRLAEIPDGSVQCCVTSPPYFNLRDYGTASWEGGDPTCKHVEVTAEQVARTSTLGMLADGTGKKLKKSNAAFRSKERLFRSKCGVCGALRVDAQIGLEKTPDQYVANLVGVFREVRRVLRDDGVCWLNLGDSHCGSTGGKQGTSGQRADRTFTAEGLGCSGVSGLKSKDLVGIPWMVAFALRADGWYLRSAIVWDKNAMPESVTDRPTHSYELIFLLTKSARYFYDRTAIAERAVSTHSSGQGYERPARRTVGVGSPEPWEPTATRNARDVWRMTATPFPDSHFATFPTHLPKRCILAGTSGHGACPSCGTPWARVLRKPPPPPRKPISGGKTAGTDAQFSQNRMNAAHEAKRRVGGKNVARTDSTSMQHRLVTNVKVARASGADHDSPFPGPRTVGWRPSCACYVELGTWHSAPPKPKDRKDRDAMRQWRKDCREVLRAQDRLLDAYARVTDLHPCMVLDPFGGAGTTAMVANRLLRNAIIVELNPEYAEMARKRIVKDIGPLVADVSIE